MDGPDRIERRDRTSSVDNAGARLGFGDDDVNVQIHIVTCDGQTTFSITVTNRTNLKTPGKNESVSKFYLTSVSHVTIIAKRRKARVDLRKPTLLLYKVTEREKSQGRA